MDALDVQGAGHAGNSSRIIIGSNFSATELADSIDTKTRIGTIRGLERVLKDGCLAQLVERRPYKA